MLGLVVGQRALFLLLSVLMFMPQMRNDDWSLASSPILVVGFDLTLLSKTLSSFGTRGGDKDSFDLFVCVLGSGLSDETAGIVLNGVREYRSVISSNCSDIRAPSPSDYNQVLYLIMPENKTGIVVGLQEISKLYHIVKRQFYSTRIGKLLWMPMFLVVWPDSKDHCQNDSTSERLIAAQLAPENGMEDDNVSRSFLLNSDLYIYLGSECPGMDLEDNVWEVYSLDGGARSVVQKLRPDNRKYESMFESLLGRVRRRLNLNNTAIKAISSKDPSSFLEGPPADILNPLEIVNGTPCVVFTELLQSLNLTAEIIQGDWLSRYPNGTLKGTTVNLFREGKVDVTISVSSLLPYRKVELSYLQPTYSNGINGFFVQPAASSFRDIAIAPFSFWLWVSLFITYVILLSSILFFGREYERLGRKYYGRAELPQSDCTLRNELALWAVGALAQQGWHIYPKCNSTRLAFTLGYFLGLVCYGAFSAAVVSILAVELIPIKTQEDLLSSSLTFYADNASSTMAYIVDFLQSNTRIEFGNKVNIEEGIARLKGKEPSCYIAFPHYFYLSAETINIDEFWICTHLSVIPVTTTGTPSSMVIPRNSKFAELFNFIILKMISRGLNNRFVRMYNDATTWRCSKSNKIFYPLGITDVFTAYCILCGGVLSSLALLCLEWLKQRISFRGRGSSRETR